MPLMPTKEQREETAKHRVNETARCFKCQQVKSWADFPSCISRRPFGLASHCRECDAVRKADLNRRSYAKKEDKRIYNKHRALVRDFGLTLQEYEGMLEAQNHKCAICQQPETVVHHATQEAQLLTVDHCHSSGKVRGLLCARCNKGLGLFLEKPERLEAAIRYVKEKCNV